MLKTFFSFKRLNTKEVSTISMLIALTVVLSYISGFLRIGNISKFSISFISVFIAAAAFGPLIGGFVGGAADIISYVFNPTGVYLWQLSAIEFIYGFIFGILFYNMTLKGAKDKFLWVKILLCVLIQLAINLFVKTLVLMSVGYLPLSFFLSVSMRAPACFIMAVFQIILIGAGSRFMPGFLKIIRN